MKKFVSLFVLAGFLLVGISCDKDPQGGPSGEPHL